MILCFKSTCKSKNHLFIIYSSCDRMFDISKKKARHKEGRGFRVRVPMRIIYYIVIKIFSYKKKSKNIFLTYLMLDAYKSTLNSDFFFGWHSNQ